MKDCFFVLNRPLTAVVNLPLITSVFSVVWKLARLCPLLKSKDTFSAKNYNLVAILSNLATVFEVILYDLAYSSISGNITPRQHKFMTRRLIAINLLEFIRIKIWMTTIK